MTKRVTTFHELVGSTDPEAHHIANLWQKYDSGRSQWKQEKKELRNFLFATDTRKTSVNTIGWKNSTTLPKLAQIRDNLHANYMAALFPNENWFKWQAGDEDAANKKKARAIETYMKNKLRVSDFETTISRIVLDYIDYGNAFGEVIHERAMTEDEDGTPVPVYIGPKLNRLSPLDIVMDPRAQRFHDSPNVTRYIVSLGDLRKMQQEQTGAHWVEDAINKVLRWRQVLIDGGMDSVDKSNAMAIDGFTNMEHYATSGQVELLVFEGDYYDAASDTLQENQRIVVADRNWVVLSEPMDSWLGESPKQHVGWRLRPDNLWAMGPLDNLVGMQYRIDHMENLKADVFDQIAHPVVFQQGHIEDWEWGPNERIYGDEESTVTPLRPDPTALNADFQIEALMQKMEELAGAPREAMGIRSPGEKTAFEVDQLATAASRIFQNKIEHFERVFLEPILNKMLEQARKNMLEAEVLAAVDDEFGVQDFISVTPDDIKAKGKLIPVGARHFAESNRIVQNLNNAVNSGAYSDPGVQAHVSGLKIAELMFGEMLGLDKFEIVRPNIRIMEAQETQGLAQAAQDQNALEAGIAPELPGGGLEEGELPPEELV